MSLLQHQFKSINSSVLSFLYGPTLTSIHDYWKNHSFDYTDFLLSLIFNMLSSLVISFLPRSKHLLISWMQSPSVVIWEPPKIKSATVSTVSPSICWAISNPKRWFCESAALNMSANLENSAVATGLEKVSVHSKSKERQCQTTAKLHSSHTLVK